MPERHQTGLSSSPLETPSPPGALFRVRREGDGRMLIQLEAGGRLAVLGPSGAGKTQLLRRLALLDPPCPLRIRLQGRSPQDWTIPRYRARVMLVSQHPALFPGSVEQNLLEPHRFAVHRGRRFDRERVLGWLGALGRDPTFLDREAAELSGGERQLLALVRALQFDPSLVLLDEPTASLDPRGRDAVEGVLTEWLADGERACLFTSHDPDQVGRLASARLELGR